MKSDQIFEKVTNQIVKAIEDGGLDPWHVPWRRTGQGMPFNALTGRSYRGGNVLAFWVTELVMDYPTSRWATFKQWKELGASVRKGEHGTHGILWKPVQCKTHGPDERCEKCHAFATGFVVFNEAQVDGYEPPAVADPLTEDQRIEQADEFFKTVGADLRFGGDKAFYAHGGDNDYIQVPEFAQFEQAEDFYSTLAHEHTHWTGHKSRLDRTFGKRFGTNTYGAEELVAELGAAFLCAQLGISNEPQPDHAQYLAGWLKMIKAEPRALFEAATKAQAATDFLVSRVSTAVAA